MNCDVYVCACTDISVYIQSNRQADRYTVDRHTCGYKVTFLKSNHTEEHISKPQRTTESRRGRKKGSSEEMIKLPE